MDHRGRSGSLKPEGSLKKMFRFKRIVAVQGLVRVPFDI